MAPSTDSARIATNIAVARIIPVILAGIVGYATWVTVVPLCVHYLLIKHKSKGAAIAILVVYFVSFLLMALAFFRLTYITIFNPPYLPLGPTAARYTRRNKSKDKSESDGIGAGEYNGGTSSGNSSRDDPDCPGLELFYTKDVFVCEVDGKPAWCSSCGNWKPDRTHHSSDVDRCILKMDHFCPWVGGAIGETNFKFFFQFTTYTALYTLTLVIVMAYYLSRQLRSKEETYNKHFAAIIGLAAFFCLFTSGMSINCLSSILGNTTQVESLGSKWRTVTLAILKPSPVERLRVNPSLASRPIFSEITYPLQIGIAPPGSYTPTAPTPQVKMYTHKRQSIPVMYPPPTLNAIGETGALPIETQPISTTNSSPVPSSAANFGTGNEQVTMSAQEKMLERDLKATRTFAILDVLRQGHNPWDLGSKLLNWETVMGTNLLDWILPIRMSPCSNHEETESHYLVGPRVDDIRVAHGFIRPQDSRRYGGRWRSKTRGSFEDKTDLQVKPKKRRLFSKRLESTDATKNPQQTPLTNGTELNNLGTAAM